MGLDGPDGSRIVWAVADPADGDGWPFSRVEAVGRLLPHLRQYVLVRQALVDAWALGASALDLLDNDRVGVIRLDRRARVTAANDRDRALLNAPGGLYDRGGRLRATLPFEDGKLQARGLIRPLRQRLLEAAGDRPIDLRNRALLAVAYDTMLRRSELASLQVSDLLEHVRGDATLLVRRSKTDGEGRGATVYLAPDTVALVRAWLQCSGIPEGRLFRSVNKGGGVGERLEPSQVPRIFKEMVRRAGLPPAVVDETLIRSVAETGPTPLVNLRFMFIRQDSRQPWPRREKPRFLCVTAVLKPPAHTRSSCRKRVKFNC